MTDAQVVKQFKVKVSALKRIHKDLAYSRKELAQEKERLQKMLDAEEKDDFRIRQQRQVVKESEVMVPDAIRRYRQAGEDLEMFMERETLAEDVAELQEEAKALLEQIDTACSSA